MNFSKQEHYAFFGTLLFGLLAHAHMLTNNYQYHDDVGFYALGAGFQLGRGSNVILGKLFRLFFGGDIISLSLFNGIITLIFLAFTAVLVIRILKLKNHIFAALTGGIMAVFPSVTSVFGYRFMAYAWALTFLLSAFGVYLITNAKFYAPARYLICITCQVFAIGIYQAVIPFTLSLATLYLFRKFIEEDYTWKNFWREILKWSGISVAFMAFYALYAMLPYGIYTLMGEEFTFTHYQGFDKAGTFSISQLLFGIFKACARSLWPSLNSMADMYPMSVRFFFYIVLIISVFLNVKIITHMYSQSRRKGHQCLITFLTVPFVIHFIYVMCISEGSFVHGIMQYAEIFTFVYFCILIEIAEQQNFITMRTHGKIQKTAFILLGIICFLYIRFDNICYLKAEYLQKRAVSYFTVLQSRIQSTPGYRDDYPVVFIDHHSRSMQNVTETKQWKNIHLLPYSWDSILNNYNAERFMSMQIGYSPEIYYAGKDVEPDNPKFLELIDKIEEQVNQMNHYPSDGSIKIIEGKVFVKF